MAMFHSYSHITIAFPPNPPNGRFIDQLIIQGFFRHDSNHYMEIIYLIYQSVLSISSIFLSIYPSIPSGNQTWHDGKQTMKSVIFLIKPPFSLGIFQPAMFDYKRIFHVDITMINHRQLVCLPSPVMGGLWHCHTHITHH